MDLSKLWFEKEIDPSSVNAMETIRKHCKSKNIEVQNLKVVSIPSYCYRYDVYRYARNFYEKESPYKEQSNIPVQAEVYSFSSFSFDDFPIRDISFEHDFDKQFETESIIVKTQKLYSCPDCGGKGSWTCRSCGGEGKKRCSVCKNRPGWRLCNYCRGEGKRRNDFSPYNWETCRECHGHGEIACGNCKGTGVVRCRSCGGKGIERCERCDGTGKIVKSVAVTDYNYITSKFTIKHNESLPDNLKRFLEGNGNGDEDFIKRLLTFEDSEPFIESIDNPFEVFEKDSPVNLFDINIKDYSSEEDSEHKLVQKRLKIRTRIYQINIIRISYIYKEKECELWLYGKDNTVFEEKDLKRLLAEEKAEEKAQEEREKAGLTVDSENDDEESVSYYSYEEESPKHRIVALILALFLGIIGVHRFYVGKVKSGILQLSLFFASSYLLDGQAESVKPTLGGIFMGVLGIWIFIDFIKICAGRFKDKHNAVLKKW